MNEAQFEEHEYPFFQLIFYIIDHGNGNQVAHQHRHVDEHSSSDPKTSYKYITYSGLCACCIGQEYVI